MTPWLKIYCTDFKLHLSDDWFCEACNKMGNLQSFELHHINSRSSSGGQKVANRIENIMSVCRPCHDKFGDLPDFKSWLFKVHQQVMEQHGVVFNREWIENQVAKWK